MMSGFAMRQAEATFRRALAAYGAACVPVWRVQRDANGVPIGGAQKVVTLYLLITSSSSVGWKRSKSYTNIALPPSHWPYSLPHTDLAQPVSLTVRCNPPSSTRSQYTAVIMWPSGYL